MNHYCKDCDLWEGYCPLKELYTFTDSEHQCDEKDINGDLMFVKIYDTNQD